MWYSSPCLLGAHLWLVEGEDPVPEEVGGGGEEDPGEGHPHQGVQHARHLAPGGDGRDVSVPWGGNTKKGLGTAT